MFETIKVEELMRGVWVEYQEERTFHKDYGKWFKDIVWGYSTDEEQRDLVEIGKFGVRGYVNIDCLRGIEITEDMLLDYGFIQVVGLKNIVTYYRDDFGHVKLDTYGIEHIYMRGKNIKWFHNFQRVFYDYTGKTLQPKQTKEPVKERELPKIIQLLKPKTADELLVQIQDAYNKINLTSNSEDVGIEF